MFGVIFHIGLFLLLFAGLSPWDLLTFRRFIDKINTYQLSAEFFRRRLVF
jgi:hypothetical protein